MARPDCMGVEQHGLRRSLRCSPVDPLELHCFVDDTAWAAFEEVQSTIFDQLLATLPAFGLRVYQSESDFQEPGPEPRRLEVDPACFDPAGTTPDEGGA